MSSGEAATVQEDEIKRAAEIREWLEGKIQDLEIEIARMRETMLIVDSILRKTSFVPAAKLREASVKIKEGQESIGVRESFVKKMSPATDVEKILQLGNESVPQKVSVETRVLRRTKDGTLLANAYITPERLDIIPRSDLILSSVTPPFQSFFVNRILNGYESKDRGLAQSGRLSPEIVVKYNIEENEGKIAKVSVMNYRETARLNEILSTITWAFTRMLEKK